MVINFAQNDQFYVFRGQDGEDFMRGLILKSVLPLRLRLPTGQLVNAVLSLTSGDTLCLTLPTDHLSNLQAEAVFDETVLHLTAKGQILHGRFNA